MADLIGLQRELQDVARRLTPAQDPDHRSEGSDSRRLVRIQVDGSGVVRGMKISHSWRKHLPPQQLADAVGEAVTAAEDARVAGWAEAIDASRPDGHRSDQSSPASDDDGRDTDDETAPPAAGADRGTNDQEPDMARDLSEIAGHIDEQAAERAMARLVDVLERVESDIDRTEQVLSEQISKAHTGQAKHVTVAVTGRGTLERLEYDEEWVAEAQDTDIVRETAAAMKEAYERAGQYSVEKLMAATPLGKMQALASDPLAFAEELGLRHGGQCG